MSRIFEALKPVEQIGASASSDLAAPTPPARRRRARTDSEIKLVDDEHASPVQVEQYRRVAAILLDAQAERRFNVIAVTSAVPQEGKTLTSVNLALTLSESFGRRVLLIDADLRRPSVHSVLGLPNAAGLSGALRSGRHELPFIELSPQLTVLPAGRPDPSPLAGLSSSRMGEIVKSCAERFDWVVIDTPPVGLLSDAQIVARLAGGVLFVIGAGSTPFAVVERALSEIGRESIIGTVLNRARQDDIPDTEYLGGYYGDDHRPSARP